VLDNYLDLAEGLTVIAASKHISLAQLAVSWTLRLHGISSVLVGVKNLGQLDEMINMPQFAISDEELAQIEKVLQKAPPTDSFSLFTEEQFS
jgi:aryl-alcohol dehydrogenase-like predicted oxidoreductase